VLNPKDRKSRHGAPKIRQCISGPALSAAPVRRVQGARAPLCLLRLARRRFFEAQQAYASTVATTTMSAVQHLARSHLFCPCGAASFTGVCYLLEGSRRPRTARISSCCVSREAPDDPTLFRACIRCRPESTRSDSMSHAVHSPCTKIARSPAGAQAPTFSSAAPSSRPGSRA